MDKLKASFNQRVETLFAFGIIVLNFKINIIPAVEHQAFNGGCKLVIIGGYHAADTSRDNMGNVCRVH